MRLPWQARPKPLPRRVALAVIRRQLEMLGADLEQFSDDELERGVLAFSRACQEIGAGTDMADRALGAFIAARFREVNYPGRRR